MLAVEAASVLKLKNGNYKGIVMGGSLVEDVFTGIWAGAMNIDSPNVGTSDNNDGNDLRCCHLAGLSFWVQTLDSNVSMPSLLGPLNTSTVQRNFISHYYSVGGGGGAVAFF